MHILPFCCVGHTVVIDSRSFVSFLAREVSVMITADEMSRVGLGTEFLVEDDPDGSESMSDENKLRRSFEGGINTLDTSPVSGKGRSEITIGDFLDHDNCREDVFLTSKCGYEWELKNGLTRDLTLERLQQELEESMNRMGIDVLDLYLLNTVRNDFSFEESFHSLNHIKTHRNVRNIGLKDPSPDQLRNALEIASLDFVQLPYNLFAREPFDTIEPICANNEVRIIVTDLFNESNRNQHSDDGEKTNGSAPTKELVRQKLESVLESYFQKNYPEDSMDALIAGWGIGQSGVHSGLLEYSENFDVEAILRVLDVQLTTEEYRDIDRLLSSVN